MIQLKLRGYSEDEKCSLLRKLLFINDCQHAFFNCSQCPDRKVCRDINNAISFLMKDVDAGYSLQADGPTIPFEIVADPTAEEDSIVPLQWAEMED